MAVAGEGCSCWKLVHTQQSCNTACTQNPAHRERAQIIQVGLLDAAAGQQAPGVQALLEGPVFDLCVKISCKLQLIKQGNSLVATGNPLEVALQVQDSRRLASEHARS